jgi:hypothetical protein
MKKIIFTGALALTLVVSSGLHAEPLYVGVVHLLTTKGTYEKLVIVGTEKGVSKSECELRREVWENDNGRILAKAGSYLKKTEGKSSGHKSSCEIKGK